MFDLGNNSKGLEHQFNFALKSALINRAMKGLVGNNLLPTLRDPAKLI